MFTKMAERVARKWQSITTDGEIKAIGDRDWAGFLEFISGLMEILMPLFALCPKDAAEVKARAARWLAAIEGGRADRRRLGLVERLRLAIWQRRVNRELGKEISDEIDNTELQRSVLAVVAEATPDEITQLRADADRLNEGTTSA